VSPAGSGKGSNPPHGSVKFVVEGEEVLEKTVRQSGNSGRIYLPPTWVGKIVKIVRVD
jgi:putative transposon-encoded protein